MLLDSAQNLSHTLHKTLHNNLRRIALQSHKLNLNLIFRYRCHYILISEKPLPLVLLIYITQCAPYDREVNNEPLSFKCPSANYTKCLLLLLPCREYITDLSVVLFKADLTANLYTNIVIHKINIRFRYCAVLNHDDKILTCHRIILTVLLNRS